MKLLVIGLIGLLLPLAPAGASLQTQYFVSSPNNSYYPGTQSSVTLLNLEFNQSYALLIGANQHVWDQQWINFTATTQSMKIPFIHENGHCRFDATNQTLTRLQLTLYDSTNTSLGSYWLTVQNYVSNANFSGWARLGVATIIFLFSGFIFVYVIIKFIIVKLL